jgi:hypothetical protein
VEWKRSLFHGDWGFMRFCAQVDILQCSDGRAASSSSNPTSELLDRCMPIQPTLIEESHHAFATETAGKIHSSAKLRPRERRWGFERKRHQRDVGDFRRLRVLLGINESLGTYHMAALMVHDPVQRSDSVEA